MRGAGAGGVHTGAMVGRVQFVPKGFGPAVPFHSAWSVKYTWR
jgi:hypothetical protein